MKLEHYNSIKARLNYPNTKFIVQKINDLDTKQQLKAVAFIQRLLNCGISLDRINTNDWNNCVDIYVYIDTRRYKRFSDHDLQRAIDRHCQLYLNKHN